VFLPVLYHRPKTKFTLSSTTPVTVSNLRVKFTKFTSVASKHCISSHPVGRQLYPIGPIGLLTHATTRPSSSRFPYQTQKTIRVRVTHNVMARHQYLDRRPGYTSPRETRTTRGKTCEYLALFYACPECETCNQYTKLQMSRTLCDINYLLATCCSTPQGILVSKSH